MLRPEYFEGKADRILELYERLENFILRDIARRILKSGKITARCIPRCYPVADPVAGLTP